jgi:hypothetical protein
MARQAADDRQPGGSRGSLIYHGFELLDAGERGRPRFHENSFADENPIRLNSWNDDARPAQRQGAFPIGI